MNLDSRQQETDGPTVGLLVTCIVDLFRPTAGEATVKLLEAAGCKIDVPAQTCCGQPAYNSGDLEDSRSVARGVIEAFEGYDYVVVPSGSCGGMVRLHYPELFEASDPWRARAQAVASRTYELMSFLTDVIGWDGVDAEFVGRVTYHDSCSGLRELKIKEQPRHLLSKVRGLELIEMADADVCCGFGGTFCVKYGEISNDMVSKKVQAIEATGADTLLAGDLSCLLNIAGRLRRLDSDVHVRHVAEVLADMTDQVPPLGENSR